MPSGGARARSGPPPDPQALKRGTAKDEATWVTLPAEGRNGDPPAWPLTRATIRETALWAELWATPQAVMWERLGSEQMVALYVRRLTVAEKRNCPANALTVVRQLAGSLGLLPDTMRSMHWRIAPTSTAEAPGTVTTLPSTRERLRAVPDASKKTQEPN